MASPNFFTKYKKEILSAILGALFTGVVSLSAGLYSLTKSFELTQKKDLLNRLRDDITILKKTEKELDHNLALFLTQNIQVDIEVEKVPLPVFEKDDKKEMIQFYEEFQKRFAGEPYKIKKATIPTEMFVLSAWPYGGPLTTEIDFDLVQNISELYRKLSLINRLMDDIRYISDNRRLYPRDIERINELKESIKSNITYITQEKILNLKNQISHEINRLAEERQKILD